MRKEIWREVVDWEGLYKISDMGRIMSLHSRAKWKILRGGLNKGYRFVTLSNQPYRQKKGWIHYLVMRAFVGPRPSKMEINHINSVRDDNRLENLEYITRHQNIQHGYDTHHFGKNNPRGTKHCLHKLTDRIVRKMRKDVSTMTYAQLRDKYPYAHNTIWCAVNRRTWKHVD